MFLKEMKNFYNMKNMSIPYHRNPWFGGHRISNFGRNFQAHDYTKLSFPSELLGVEKTLRDLIQFYCPVLIHEFLPLGSWNFGRGFYAHYYYIFSLSVQGKELRIRFLYISTYFTVKAT